MQSWPAVIEPEIITLRRDVKITQLILSSHDTLLAAPDLDSLDPDTHESLGETDSELVKMTAAR